VHPIKPAPLQRHGWQPPRGLPVGNMRGHARVRDDASLADLALDRADGLLATADARQPIVRMATVGDMIWQAGYVPGTNVLETTGHDDDGELRIVDFMPVAEGRPGQAESVSPARFVRIVTCTEGEVSFRLVCGGSADGRSGTQALTKQGWYLACSSAMAPGDEATEANVHLRAGESVALVIAQDAVQGGAGLIADALHALGDTIHYWTWWSDRCRYKGDDFDGVLRDALNLKLACSAGGGLLVEDAGANGFAPAPLGECTRAAGTFLSLGYRNECVALLSHVVSQAHADTAGRWSPDACVSATLADYVTKYGDTGLPDALRAAWPQTGLPPAKQA